MKVNFLFFYPPTSSASPVSFVSAAERKPEKRIAIENGWNQNGAHLKAETTKLSSSFFLLPTTSTTLCHAFTQEEETVGDVVDVRVEVDVESWRRKAERDAVEAPFSTVTFRHPRVSFLRLE